MAKRGDNIRKRKDGRWEGRYKKGRAVDGSIIYGSVYGKTYKEVKEKMTSIISHPLQLATPKDQGKTFGEVLNLWILSAEEQKKLEASLLNNFDLTGAGIYISLHTGLRIGEVCSLAWNDIDMNKRVIHVRHQNY